MSSDLELLFVFVLLVAGGFSLMAAWLRDFSNLVWMLGLRRGVVFGSVIASAVCVYGLGYWAIPLENLGALRLLATIVFAPLVARPLADRVALAISRRWTLKAARPYLNDVAQHARALTVCAVVVLVISLFLAPGAVWAGPRIVLVLALAPLGRRPVHALLTMALAERGERATTRDYVFDAVASQQQTLFLASLGPGEGAEPYGEADDLFDVVEPASPSAAPQG